MPWCNLKRNAVATGLGRAHGLSQITSHIVAISEVFSAGEDVIAGASRDDLVAGLVRHGHRHASALLEEDDLEQLVRANAKAGDMVVCLGAGTISAWANALPARLQQG